MKAFHIIAATAAAVGVASFAVPALGQTAYPYQQPYPQAYPQYQYPQAYPQAYPQTGYGYPGQPSYGAQNPLPYQGPTSISLFGRRIP